MQYQAVSKIGALTLEHKLPTLYTDIGDYTSVVNQLDYVTSAMAALIGKAPAGCYGGMDKMPDLNKVERDGDGRQVLAFVAMAGFCSMAKPITLNPDNSDYLQKRWKAACASAGLEERPMLTKDAKDCIQVFQDWIGPRHEIKRMWARTLLDNDVANVDLKDQILLVWRYYGMKSCQMMAEFIGQASLPWLWRL